MWFYIDNRVAHTKMLKCELPHFLLILYKQSNYSGYNTKPMSITDFLSSVRCCNLQFSYCVTVNYVTVYSLIGSQKKKTEEFVSVLSLCGCYGQFLV